MKRKRDSATRGFSESLDCRNVRVVRHPPIFQYEPPKGVNHPSPRGQLATESERQWIARVRKATAEQDKPARSPLVLARDLAAALTGILPAVRHLLPEWHQRGRKIVFRGLRIEERHLNDKKHRYVQTNTYDLGVYIPPVGKKKRIHLLQDLNTRPFGMLILNFTDQKFAKTQPQRELWEELSLLTKEYPTPYELMTRFAASSKFRLSREDVDTVLGRAVERIAEEAADTPKYDKRRRKRRRKFIPKTFLHYRTWCCGILENVIHEWRRESRGNVEPEEQRTKGRRVLEYTDGNLTLEVPDMPAQPTKKAPQDE
jgi:hypothetical protein